MKLPSTGVLVRAAVVLTLAGLVLLLPILFEVNALNVGLFMLAGVLITAGLALYVAAVVRDLRRREIL